MLYLALDQGGNSSRAIVFTAQGEIVCKFQKTVGVNNIRPGWVEQDPRQLADSLIKVTNDALEYVVESGVAIASLGLATQRSNIVCWDINTGRALSPAISWQDRRAYKWMAGFSAHNELVRSKTGLLITAHYGVSKLKWCLDYLPEVKTALENDSLAFGPLASYLVRQLLQQPVHYVDPANASRTLLWNVDSNDWDDELLALFQMPRQPLPQCVMSEFEFGMLRTPQGEIPLKIVTGDQSAAFFANGLPSEKTGYINMGTGAFIQVSTGAQRLDIPGVLSSLVFQNNAGRHYVVECTINGASNALMQMEDELNISQQQAEKEFTRWLEECTDPPLYLNGVAGLGAPFWVPDFPSRIVGKGRDWEKIVAVAESILFLININLEHLAAHGIVLQRLVLSGGLSNNVTLCQKLANLTGLPVHRPAQLEATAKGLAFLLAGQPAEWNSGGLETRFEKQVDDKLHARYLQWRILMLEEINATSQ